MDNYLLFKQAVCLILFFETVWVWPSFYRYFGPQVFPKSLFTTSLRIVAFHLLLLTTLIFLFLDYYAVYASFILFVCMRYLFVTLGKTRISTLGAVGHISYFTAAYIFLFEIAWAIDPTHQLTGFLHTVLAIEIGIIMVEAGVIKSIFGYFRESGIEYALVNPLWGKFFFLFMKLKPSSWFFKMNNYAGVLLEILSGLLFFIPQTWIFGAYLLQILFLYAFLTVRANILPWLMMSIALLYIQPLAFHFPTLNVHPPQLAISSVMITLIEAIFILYLAVYISIALFRLLQLTKKVRTPAILEKPLRFLIAARPYFEWNVFTFGVTDYFIKVDKASKTTQQITSTLYDGFSKNYQELFEDPGLFFRFIHHHESSFLMCLFLPMRFDQIQDAEQLKEFVRRMANYAKTYLSASELEDTAIVYTVMHIEKAGDAFAYMPVARFFVDANSGTLITALKP